MEFVVNEWLPEYFKPDCSVEQKNLLNKFILKFFEKNDQIFIRNPSPFLDKLYRFEKNYFEPKLRKPVSFFIQNILENSDKCVQVMEEINLPQNITKLLSKGNFASDTYLFEAASLTNSKKIITTDIKLIKQFEDNNIFELILLEDFLKEY